MNFHIFEANLIDIPSKILVWVCVLHLSMEKAELNSTSMIKIPKSEASALLSTFYRAGFMYFYYNSFGWYLHSCRT